jgi:AraC-like DNA-binding protein
MHATALASSHMLLWKTAESYGLDSAALFREAGLDPEKIKDSEARYDEEDSMRLLELISAASGDPCFGLRVGTFWHPSALHGLGFAWMASASLQEALERLVRYFRILIVGERLLLEQTREGFWLSIETPMEYPRAPDMLYDLMLAAVVHMCRLSVGEDFNDLDLNPLRVVLRRPEPPCADQFTDYFQAPVAFEAGRDALLLPGDALMAPLPTANLEIAHASEKVIQSYLAGLDRTEIAVQVAAKLVDMLPSGEASEQAVADALHMSLRSLQRKLKAEGTSYKTLLDSTRRDLAVQYVRSSRMSINEITYLLGFSEPGNFSRAFKRWTGNSPSEYRAAG